MKTYRFLHRWHQRLGVIAALILIMLVFTGILLNHTETLKLDERFIDNQALLNWYDISPQQAPIAYAVGSHYISLIGDQAFLDNRAIAFESNVLIGAELINDQIILASTTELVLFDDQGELIDIISQLDGLPIPIEKIGHADQTLIIQTAENRLRVDLENFTWEKSTREHIEWAAQTALPDDLNTQLLQQYRGAGLPLERVLLDLHSGRLFGEVGVIIVDIAAIILLILALSGCWMWIKRR